MDKYQETFDTWNKVALLYQEKFMNLPLYNQSYDIICDTLTNKNASILEIGCGPGNITKYLLSKRPDFKIMGIDVAENMIELAKKNNPTANFKIMDCRKVNELNQKYDGIVCGFCLPYLSPSDCSKLISDCQKLMNNKGLIYLSFVGGDADKSGFQNGSSGNRAYFYYHNATELAAELKRNTFENIQVLKVEYARTETEKEVHTILIAQKK